MMTAEEMKQQKAKALRYKKPIMEYMNLDSIRESVYEMGELISDVQWFCDDEDNLVNALDGDEDEAWQFKLAFSDLAAELEQFEYDLQDGYVPDCFDDLFPAVNTGGLGGMFGWDSYEHDYYGLDPYEYGYASKDAAKRICRLTKNELLEAVGACLKVYASFTALKYRYDCLEASLKIIQEKNLEGLKLIKAIEEQYKKAESISEGFKWTYHKEVEEFDRMLEQVPQEYWIQ